MELSAVKSSTLSLYVISISGSVLELVKLAGLQNSEPRSMSKCLFYNNYLVSSHRSLTLTTSPVYLWLSSFTFCDRVLKANKVVWKCYHGESLVTPCDLLHRYMAGDKISPLSLSATETATDTSQCQRKQLELAPTMHLRLLRGAAAPLRRQHIAIQSGFVCLTLSLSPVVKCHYVTGLRLASAPLLPPHSELTVTTATQDHITPPPSTQVKCHLLIFCGQFYSSQPFQRSWLIMDFFFLNAGSWNTNVTAAYNS